VGEVRFVPPGGVGMRGEVDAERGRGCMADGLLICVRDNSRVVGSLCPCHPVTGGLCLWAVSCRMRAVFTVEQAVKSARLLRTSSAPTASSVSAALGGYSWRRGASSAGCWLAMLCTCC
jgi:hypothetical protein